MCIYMCVYYKAIFLAKKLKIWIGKRPTFMKKKKLVYFENFSPFVSLLNLKSLDLLSIFHEYIIIFLYWFSTSILLLTNITDPKI